MSLIIRQLNQIRKITSMVLPQVSIYDDIKHRFGYNITRGIDLFRRDCVQIVEVGLRDGLQNHSKFISTNKKKKLIDKLVNAGISNIEATAFVSPKAVPQMADHRDIMNYCNSNLWGRNIKFSALVPNVHYYDISVECNLKNVAIFTTVSETFCEKNLRCSIDESLSRYKEICEKSKKNGNFVRGYVSCIAGCPYEGHINFEKIIYVCNTLIDMGCDEISLGDTIGIGTPGQIEYILHSLILNGIPVDKLAVHFHDTNGSALDNIKVALEKGISVIDSSINGLGGCPFAPGAPGNVATEKVVNMLHNMGYETDIDTHLLEEAREYANKITI